MNQEPPRELVLTGARWDELDAADRDRLLELVEWHGRERPLQSLHVTMLQTFAGATSFVVMKAVPV